MKYEKQSEETIELSTDILVVGADRGGLSATLYSNEARQDVLLQFSRQKVHDFRTI